jgi:hypothetical protein
MPFGQLVKGLHSGFANWLNRRQGRLGPVFAHRPTTLNVELVAARWLISYQHNNPVRAGVVDRASECGWTSHRAYLGLEDSPPWLSTDLGLELAGFSADSVGRGQFDRFANADNRESGDDAMTGGDLCRAREDARRHTRCPVEVGYPTLAGQALVYPITGSAPRWEGSLGDIVDAVSEQSGVAVSAIRCPTRRPQIVAARRLVVLVARLLGITQQEVGQELRVSREAVSLLARRSGHSAVEVAEGMAKRISGATPDGPRAASWIRRLA